MFLAINEIKQAKFRYGLIISLMLLISYLVFFLAGLANGLANLNRSGVDIWQADAILLSEDAFQTLTLSKIEKETIDQVEAEEKAALALQSTVIWTSQAPSDEDKVKATIFAVDQSSFLAPKVLEGRAIFDKNQALISKRLARENAYQIGDTIKLAKSDMALEIVGITQEASYNVAPLIYTDFETYDRLLADLNPPMQGKINALVVQGSLTAYPKESLEKLSISDFINQIPGYSAQVLTFGFMIGFLVLIVAIVIGIFMYVLTMQKTQIFGVMKTQGISTAYIGRSVLIQTLILVLVGVSLGLALTVLSALLLPSQVPFLMNWMLNGAICLGLVLCSILGSLFSVGIVAKIDPLKSIS
ncbi:putative ABC transport system permease protein [Streptococcus rupicaprae]|uniref:Putative hemin transport system permease protein HrtB n=1 Tax=Streptococcus rupicaprae TaxID=759619 RepID=A0ABV2FKQ0_9STRE